MLACRLDSLWFPSQDVIFVSVFLCGILYDFHLRMWFIRGFCFSAPTRHSLWFPSQVVDLFQCSYAAFFMISISGCGFCFSVPTRHSFFMISISGCGFCFSAPTRHSLWFPSQVADFVSVLLRGLLLRGECVQAVRGGPGQLTRLRAWQVLRRLRVQ